MTIDAETKKKREEEQEAARRRDQEKLMRLMRYTSYYENAYNEAYHRGTSFESGTVKYENKNGDSVAYPDFGRDREALNRFLDGSNDRRAKAAAAKAFEDANFDHVGYNPDTDTYIK